MDEALVPDFMDEVKNIKSGVFGVVDAAYTIGGVDYLDVLVDRSMHYKMVAANWEVVKKYSE